MSTEEEIARRYAHRSGFALVGYRRVAIPVFRATVRVLMLEKKPLPVIPEFILRAIECGMLTPAEIAGILGLDQPVVDDGLRALLHSDDVMIGAVNESREHRVIITPKGRQTLSNARMIVPEEIEYQIDIDGLTRKAIPFLRQQAVRPIEVGKEGLTEIPASPRRKPNFEEVNQQARRYHNELQREGQESHRDLLDVLHLERVERLFRTDAIMLLYRAENGKETQAGFAIAEIQSPEHEAAFTRLKNDSLRPIIPESLAEDIHEVKPDWLPEDFDLSKSRERTTHLRSDVDRAHQEIRELTGRLNDTDSVNEKALLRAQLKAAEENLERLQATIDAITVHGVEVYEHPTYLQQAFDTARERLLIISPWIKGYVVNETFLKSLQTVIDRGATVYIGYGLDGENDRETDRDRAAIAKLEQLSKKNKGFRFKRLGDTHAKVLICDDWYISTSFNWLSFRGDPRLPFRDERGTYVRVKDAVEDMFSKYEVRF